MPVLTRRQKIIAGVAGVLLLLTAAIAVVTADRGREEIKLQPAAEAAGTPVKAKEEDIYVHAAGKVKNPGLYRLPAGSRVNDLIAKAGGLLPEADANAVNLAARLNDGEKVYFPAVGEAPPSGSGGGGGDTGLVNINTADVARLDTLPGIGPSLAARIVEYRRVHGPFRRKEDLKNVPGIGEKKYQDIKDLITVQ